MRVVNFFEIVGQMVSRKYVSIDDIDGIFRGPILDIEMAFTKHIHERQNEKGVPQGLYANALSLFDRIGGRS